MPRIRFAALALLVATVAAVCQTKPEVKTPAEKAPPELGRVPFLRDYAAAAAKAAKEKKPLFVLFDEVPG